MPRIGQLDRQISVWKKQVTRDPDYNTETVDWVPLIPKVGFPLESERLWAEVIDSLPSNNEALVRQEIQVASFTKRIRLRYRDDIDPSMRVTVHGDTDETYEIVGGPAMIDRKRWLELFCERMTS